MSLSDQDINDRITYHPPSPVAKDAHEALREMIRVAMETVRFRVPEGREQSLAFTKLEEAMFWANAGVARNHDRL